MHIAINASFLQQQELIEKGFPAEIVVEWLQADDVESCKADVVFDLLFNDTDLSLNKYITGKTVFVHALNCTCQEINKPNYIRLNAWPGFLNRIVIELATSDADNKTKAEKIFEKLNWQFVWVKDDYGLIAARIIAAIINEAYYALEEKVSSKKEIDIAMKSGTNYPFGPFEWSEHIGITHIYKLLQKIAAKNARYTICRLLLQESQQFQF